MGDGGVGVHFGHVGNVQRGTDGFGGFLACGDNCQAMRQLLQESRNIGGHDHFEKLVGGVVLQSSDGCGRVEEGDTLCLAVRYNLFQFEAFVLHIHEVVPVAKKDLSLNAPMVVDEIGVIEVHAPAFPLWWKTAEEEHFSVLGQERNERMKLHLRRASGNVVGVQVGHTLWFCCCKDSEVLANICPGEKFF